MPHVNAFLKAKYTSYIIHVDFDELNWRLLQVLAILFKLLFTDKIIVTTYRNLREPDNIYREII